MHTGYYLKLKGVPAAAMRLGILQVAIGKGTIRISKSWLEFCVSKCCQTMKDFESKQIREARGRSSQWIDLIKDIRWNCSNLSATRTPDTIILTFFSSNKVPTKKSCLCYRKESRSSFFSRCATNWDVMDSKKPRGRQFKMESQI